MWPARRGWTNLNAPLSATSPQHSVTLRLRKQLKTCVAKAAVAQCRSSHVALQIDAFEARLAAQRIPAERLYTNTADTFTRTRRSDP